MRRPVYYYCMLCSHGHSQLSVCFRWPWSLFHWRCRNKESLLSFNNAYLHETWK